MCWKSLWGILPPAWNFVAVSTQASTIYQDQWRGNMVSSASWSWSTLANEWTQNGWSVFVFSLDSYNNNIGEVSEDERKGSPRNDDDDPIKLSSAAWTSAVKMFSSEY